MHIDLLGDSGDLGLRKSGWVWPVASHKCSVLGEIPDEWTSRTNLMHLDRPELPNVHRVVVIELTCTFSFLISS